MSSPTSGTVLSILESISSSFSSLYPFLFMFVYIFLVLFVCYTYLESSPEGDSRRWDE